MYVKKEVYVYYLFHMENEKNGFLGERPVFKATELYWYPNTTNIKNINHSI